MAIAMVSWASRLMEPNDAAPVANRFTISEAGSTSAMGTGLRSCLKFSRPRSVANFLVWSSVWRLKSL